MSNNKMQRYYSLLYSQALFHVAVPCSTRTHAHMRMRVHTHTHTHTHNRLTAFGPVLTE